MDGRWQRKISCADNEKRKKIILGKNRTTKSRKNYKARRKGKLRVLVNIESEHHQTIGDEKN